VQSSFENAVVDFDAKNYEAAAKRLSPLADKNFEPALALLGRMSVFGDGMEPDSEKAADYFVRSVRSLEGEQKFPPDLHKTPALADSYLSAVAKWSSDAAAAGNPGAEYAMGLLYMHGRGVPFSSERGVRYLQKAATEGFLPAQMRLGDMFYFGRGVPRNLRLAMLYFIHAAKAGDSISQFRLGTIYFQGAGVERNPALAVQFFTEAASRKNPAAQYMLGSLYYEGKVVPRNLTQAAKWLMLAKKSADKEMREAVKNLLSKVEDEASSEELKAAKKEVSSFH